MDRAGCPGCTFLHTQIHEKLKVGTSSATTTSATVVL